MTFIQQVTEQLDRMNETEEYCLKVKNQAIYLECEPHYYEFDDVSEAEC